MANVSGHWRRSSDQLPLDPVLMGGSNALDDIALAVERQDAMGVVG
jgi:hypothetical protein